MPLWLAAIVYSVGAEPTIKARRALGVLAKFGWHTC